MVAEVRLRQGPGPAWVNYPTLQRLKNAYDPVAIRSVLVLKMVPHSPIEVM